MILVNLCGIDNVSEFVMKFKDQISRKLEAIIEKYVSPGNFESIVKIPEEYQSLFLSMKGGTGTIIYQIVNCFLC